MSTDFILPDIGEGIVECEIVEWHVKEGDTVKEDQTIVDVMTDKAVVEIPSKFDGVITKLYHAKGEIAQVGAPLFAIEREGGAVEPVAAQEAPATNAEAAPAASAQTPAVVSTARTAGGEFEAPQPAADGKALASPAVRRLARELDVDLTQVQGSGKKGRVLREDLEGLSSQAPATASSVGTAQATGALATGGSRVEPIRGIQAAMAKQMMASVSTIPHFTYAEEFDLTEMIALRAQLKPVFEEQGVRLTVMAFFIKALSLALNQFPKMNAHVNNEGTEVTYFDDHNIGMAVATPMGLMVPNIKAVQHLSLMEVAEEVSRLTQSAREGKLAPADMKGGTITISNIGIIGGTVTTPIINKPEVAIVALGKTQALPRFDAQGNVVSRSIMVGSWSGDHRVVDGALIASFNKLWQSYLENPSLMLGVMR